MIPVHAVQEKNISIAAERKNREDALSDILQGKRQDAEVIPDTCLFSLTFRGIRLCLVINQYSIWVNMLHTFIGKMFIQETSDSIFRSRYVGMAFCVPVKGKA